MAASALTADRPRTNDGAAPHLYPMFGCFVESDFRLPLPEIRPGAGDRADWRFSRAEGDLDPAARELLAGGETHLDGQVVVRRAESGAWIRYRGVGTFHVTPDSRRVDVYAEPEASEQILGLVLAGQISVFVLHQLGYPTLHASAVVTERGAIAFLGRWGQGKSTMTAAFLRQGATLLTDDVLPLRLAEDIVRAGPGLPLMKLWPEAARRALGLSAELPNLIPDGLSPGYDKKLVELGGCAESPVRLAAIYVLQRYDAARAGMDEIAVERLSGHVGLVAVLEHVSEGAFLTPAEVGRLLPIYVQAIRQAPVRLLRYPSGFERQADVLDRVLQDLSSRGARHE